MLLAEQVRRPLFEFTLAPLSEDHGIPLAVMGIVVVFMVLVLVATFIAILPRVLARIAALHPEPAAPLPPITDEELPEETLVVIAAAVAAVIGTPHRVVRIRGFTAEDIGWSLEGRMQHHHSHRIPHRDR